MSKTDPSATSGRLQRIRDDALSLEAAYPDYYEMRGLSKEDLMLLASQRLVSLGIAEAENVVWVSEHVDIVTLRVLAKARLLHRLVELLDRRGDVESGLRFARSRGCDEQESLDAVEDAVVSVIQRGHGLKIEETLLRFFRTILWEKISDAIERKGKRLQLEEAYLQYAPCRPPSQPTSPLELVSATEARDLLISSLNGADLPFARKASLLLKYGAGWTTGEIACLLGMSPGQVDTMNHRTREQIRARLQGSRDELVGVANSSGDHAAQIQVFARSLAEKREQAAVVLHSIFSQPAKDVMDLCGVSEVRLQQLSASADSREGRNARPK